MPCSSQRGGAG